MKHRPSTTVILAMTADGKIADEARSPARFGSAVDKAHLEEQISLVDAVLFGAGTLRAYGTSLPITNPELLQQRQERSRSPQPVQIVCSASGNIDPHLRFFRQPIPRWLITTATGAKVWRGKREFDRILGVETKDELNKSLYWSEILTQLKLFGIDKLAILGGGELIASLLKEDAIDEFWLTICPLIIGGREAPTPVEGIGFSQQQGSKLELLEVKQIEQEIFLHYRLQH
jgi:5-amino-6-(5-phosphoribosylamino)uracil reductase